MSRTTPATRTMTLTEAARTLRVKYLKAYNLMLEGVLDSGPSTDDHWLVTAASVQQYAREQAAAR